MGRTPENCRYREASVSESGTDIFCCALARQIMGPHVDASCAVGDDICKVCCRWPHPSPGDVNPVVASLVYGVAAKILRIEDASTRQIEEATRAQQHVLKSLQIEEEGSAGFAASAAPLAGDVNGDQRCLHGPSRSRKVRLTWAVGLLTAPRPKPTILPTLKSLQAGGFDFLHIFAEPGAWIPGEFQHLPITQHGQTLGNLGNFHSALIALYMTQPHADCYAVFQDDIQVALGLKAWCDDQFWPDCTGLVSLFTPRAYQDSKQGWRILALGLHRTFGAQAFVFRRDLLLEFLGDSASLRYREAHVHGDDAVVGAWATARGMGIAYHHPSLVQHIGDVTSIPGHAVGRHGQAVAVTSVDQIATWECARPEPGKIGLVGWNTATGLGYQNRDIAVYASVDRWLVPRHPEYPTLSDPRTHCRIDRVARDMSPGAIRAWLDGLDWIVFVELTYVKRLPQLARELGISVACVPNWEWTNLSMDWLNCVDLMICPTQYTYQLLSDWKHRFGFAWDVVHVPWPIDTGRFSFRCRQRCRRFLFVNGTGGCPARRPDGSLTEYRRKGCEVVFQAASMVPEIPLIVYSQTSDIPRAPRNVELRKPPRKNDQLYRDGDVCVQPSSWEGLGLQLLECQAAGLPLVTTDAPPMNEYHPLRTVPVAEKEIVSVCGNHPITSNQVSPSDLAQILAELFEMDIAAASRNAREFVEREHGWREAQHLFRETLLK
jgi:glycosyltransferase involved in cell wall biosynthesis